MARISITQMAAVQDPLQTWNWQVVFPRVPGVADTRQLTLRAVSTNAPGSQVEQATWEGHGMALSFGGRRTFGKTWDCTFIEARDASTRDGLKNWADTIRSWRNNTGAYKSEYAVTVELTLFDAADKEARTIRLYGCFPTNIQDVSLDQSSTVMQIACTLSFDYTEEV